MPKPNPEEIAQQRKQMEKMNCGFDKVEHLSGNVGYLKFDFFGDPDVCGPTAVAAMNSSPMSTRLFSTCAKTAAAIRKWSPFFPPIYLTSPRT